MALKLMRSKAKTTKIVKKAAAKAAPKAELSPRAIEYPPDLGKYEKVCYKIFHALGAERVKTGLETFSRHNVCCRSWQGCFLAHAMGFSSDAERYDEDQAERVAKQLGGAVTRRDVQTFIEAYDGYNAWVSPAQMQSLARRFLIENT